MNELCVRNVMYVTTPC